MTIAEKKEHNDRYKELSTQQSEMLNDYREKLGLHKGDATGEQGYSYKEPMPESEQKELEDLKEKKDYSKLHGLYSQAPEEHHITKLLKYPMSSNLKTFGDTTTKEAPEEKGLDFNAPKDKPKSKPTVAPIENKKVKVEKPEPKINPIDASEKIESHFPTVGIQSTNSLNKTLREYGHTPEESEKEYKPKSLVDFNGSKYSVDKDGGTYVIAKNLDTGKTETLHKGDLENYPTDQKLPAINKQTVQNFMSKHEDGMPLEEIYSKMGFPKDAKGKEYIKNRLKVALLQLEHHHETGGYHEPVVSREVGKPHPDEKNPKEKGIMYKLAKSVISFATQTLQHIKSNNLIKSFMIELYPKEKSIYEKSLNSKNIFETFEETKTKEKMVIGILDTIQQLTLKKSSFQTSQLYNIMLDESTEYLCKSGSRFNLLKSMDDGSFQKAVTTAMELEQQEEKYAIYKSLNTKPNAEDISDNKGTEQ